VTPKEIEDVVTQAIEKQVKLQSGEKWLNQENKACLQIIKNPDCIGFDHSHQHGLDKKEPPGPKNNHGETSYRSELYKRQERWLDEEITIGFFPCQGKKRIDLIGYEDGQFILCELKKDGKGSSHPFDALLQVLAYYLIIRKNAKTLHDKEFYRRGTSRWQNRGLTWLDVKKSDEENKLRLLVYAKKWSAKRATFKASKPKNDAMDEIIKGCAGKLQIDVDAEND